MLIIRSAEVLCEGDVREIDVLLGGGRILAMAAGLDSASGLPGIQVIDGSQLIALPGFVDSHVHICGGGGEGGFSTRTPEIKLTDLTTAGVTTVVGCLGTDGVTRSLDGLYAKAGALQAEGINSYILTGNYRIPPITFTGSILRDMVLMDKVLGVGEVAISDHRSSQPTYEEFCRLAADVRVGAMLSGKSGVINVHLGDGVRMMALIEAVVNETEIPVRHFLPTHMNRNPELFEKAIAFGRSGGYVDFTTSTVPQFIEDGEVAADEAMDRCLKAGVPSDRICFSSDAQGSLPLYDKAGELHGMTVGKPSSLYEAVRRAVERGVPLETAVSAITSNPARVLGLGHVGRLAPGMAADVVLVHRDTLEIVYVIARGQVMVCEGEPVVKDAF